MIAYTTLTVAAVSTGLFTRLLITILAFFQRALKDLTGPRSTLVVQRFFGEHATATSALAWSGASAREQPLFFSWPAWP